MPRRTTGTKRLTEHRVRQLEYPTRRKLGSPYFVPDHEVARLYVRVLPSGRKTYVIRYYTAERKKRNLTLGTTDQLRLVDARSVARQKLAELDLNGVDPKQPKAEPVEVPTLGEFVERYFRDHSDQKRSGAELRRLYKRRLQKRFSEQRLDAIRLDDLLTMRTKLRDKPYEFNRARDLLQAIINKAIYWEVLPDEHRNPVRKVPRYDEKPRDRVLTTDEVSRIVEAIDHINSVHTRVFFWTLLEVPFRKSELMRATWEGFDTEKRILRVEAKSSIKGVSAQPLRPEIADQIAALPRFDGNPYIFPDRYRETHIKDIDSQWKRIKKLAGVKNARLHDLRRTIATDYARLGASTYQIQTALGQKTDIAAKHYVHLAAAEVSRELMERRAKGMDSST